MTANMGYLLDEENRSEFVLFARNGSVGEDQCFRFRSSMFPLVTSHEPMDVGVLVTTVRYDILHWFANEYPQSRLETGGVAWQFEWDARSYILWRTDNENAAVMMRMRWS
jgi:YD repeat-containing protein